MGEVAVDPLLIQIADVDLPEFDIDTRLSPTTEPALLELDRLPTTIVMLGYTSIDSEQADTRTMLDVILLRRRCAAAGCTPRMIVQMLDEERADLAELTGPDDLLFSAALGSQFIAQLIEQPERRAVLLELYGGNAASIRMVRCGLLELVGTFTTHDVIAASYAAGVLAIGWRRTDDGAVVLNPGAAECVTLSADDEIIVVG